MIHKLLLKIIRLLHYLVWMIIHFLLLLVMKYQQLLKKILLETPQKILKLMIFKMLIHAALTVTHTTVVMIAVSSKMVS